MADHFMTQRKLAELQDYSLYDIAGEVVTLEERVEELQGVIDDLEDQLAAHWANVYAAAPSGPLIERLSDEADLCRNEGADDIAGLLDEARAALMGQRCSGQCQTIFDCDGFHTDNCLALAAATGTAKTPKAVECEASQSGPKGNAQ